MKKFVQKSLNVILALGFMAGVFGGCTPDGNGTSSTESAKQEETVLKQLPNEGDYQNVFYVAPDGNDNNTGAWDAPFKTIEKAKTEVAKINDDMSKDIAVVLREGTYRQTKSVNFGLEDSGTNGHDIIYMAYPGEQVNVSGGVKLGKWKKVEGKEYYATSVGADSIRHLYINGNRAILARTPDSGYTQATKWDAANRQVLVPAASLKGATKFEAIMYMEWAEMTSRVKGVKLTGSTAALQFEDWEKKYLFEFGFHEYQIHDDMYIYYQNAMEFLDAPGEFYYDKTAQKLFYYPRENENMESVEAVVPAVDSVFKFSGTMKKNRVKNIVLDGLIIEHTGFSDINKYGFMEYQSGHYGITHIGGPWFGNDVAKGAVHILNAENIHVKNCVVRHAGGTGINFYSATKNCSAIGNAVYDISSMGIITSPHINGVVVDDNLYTPVDDNITVNHIDILNNYVAWTGVEFSRSSAIANMLGYDINISNNEIAYATYSGISNGWGWSLEEYACKRNTVSGNNIHHIGINGSDLGGIYNLNNQPGTVIQNNYVHEIQSTGMGNSQYSPADGLYLDEGSNNLVVSGNQIAYANEQSRLIYINKNTTAIGNNNRLENNKGLLRGDTLVGEIVAAAGVQSQYAGALSYEKKGNAAIDRLLIGSHTNAEGGIMGYKLKVNEDVTVRGLGRFYWLGNTGTHKLMIYDENKQLVAWTSVQAGTTAVDEHGFEYGLFDAPVTLEKGKSYYIVGMETAGGDLYLGNNTKLYLSAAFTLQGGVKGNGLALDSTVKSFGAYIPLV